MREFKTKIDKDTIKYLNEFKHPLNAIFNILNDMAVYLDFEGQN